MGGNGFDYDVIVIGSGFSGSPTSWDLRGPTEAC
jgi:hypothetical protein